MTFFGNLKSFLIYSVFFFGLSGHPMATIIGGIGMLASIMRMILFPAIRHQIETICPAFLFILEKRVVPRLNGTERRALERVYSLLMNEEILFSLRFNRSPEGVLVEVGNDTYGWYELGSILLYLGIATPGKSLTLEIMANLLKTHWKSVMDFFKKQKIRAPQESQFSWEKWVVPIEQQIKNTSLFASSDENSIADPQMAFQLAIKINELQLLHYSRGDPVCVLCHHFDALLGAWELSHRLAEITCQERPIKICQDWTFALSNLKHYNWCFCLVGLALTLEIPDEQWRRLLVLVGGEAEDELLDRVIMSRQTGRKIGHALLHPEPYRHLLNAIDASGKKQAVLLRDFVDHWYRELAHQSKNDLVYIYASETHPLDKERFGRWCVEAVAATKAFGLDDRRCLGHERYPSDLLHPNSELAKSNISISPSAVQFILHHQ